jgi:RNA polymerase sigma-70 factor (ECF subfamily)
MSMIHPFPRIRGRSKGTSERTIRAARRGSTEAVETLVREHWDGAYRVGVLITGDPGVAEDIAQESVLAALRGLDRFDETRPFAPWLERIAANASVDWLRRRQRRPEVVVDDVSEVGDEAALADTVANAALDQDIVAALKRLTPEFRAVVVLRYLLDLEPREIAPMLSIPPATVRTRLHRGLRQLRDELTNEVGETDEQAG